MERAYTVKEIDELRGVVLNRILWGNANSWGWCAEHAKPIKQIEELVRTHMLAGHTAQDICEEDSRRMK